MKYLKTFEQQTTLFGVEPKYDKDPRQLEIPFKDKEEKDPSQLEIDFSPIVNNSYDILDKSGKLHNEYYLPYIHNFKKQLDSVKAEWSIVGEERMRISHILSYGPGNKLLLNKILGWMKREKIETKVSNVFKWIEDNKNKMFTPGHFMYKDIIKLLTNTIKKGDFAEKKAISELFKILRNSEKGYVQLLDTSQKADILDGVDLTFKVGNETLKFQVKVFDSFTEKDNQIVIFSPSSVRKSDVHYYFFYNSEKDIWVLVDVNEMTLGESLYIISSEGIVDTNSEEMRTIQDDIRQYQYRKDTEQEIADINKEVLVFYKNELDRLEAEENPDNEEEIQYLKDIIESFE